MIQHYIMDVMMRQYIARRPQLNMNLKTISMHLVRPNVTLVHLAMMRQSHLVKNEVFLCLASIC